ncbi:peptidoglycan-binding protein [Streptomyces nigra]|uniref:peptidoglycan-binding domain-containing protein n=1 Tax=Streptomyces nigra TaxID=1827580 RepID=UPI0036C646BE
MFGALSALQFTLNKCYGAGLAVDGAYGPATRAAVTSVQQRVGVAADGDYGPATRSAMNWSPCTPLSPPVASWTWSRRSSVGSPRWTPARRPCGPAPGSSTRADGQAGKYPITSASWPGRRPVRPSSPTPAACSPRTPATNPATSTKAR